MIDPGGIVELYKVRKNLWAPEHGKMTTMQDHYENMVSTILPELDTNEKSAIANLISQGVDQMAMRIASTTPSIIYPPVKRGNEKSEAYAEIRRLANYSWWDANKFDRKQRIRAKWLVAFAASPVLLRPDFQRKIPKWQLVHPTNVFPAPMPDLDEICPTDAILAYKRHYRWLLEMYPEKANALEMGKNPSMDSQLEVLEYIDGDEHVLVAVGKPFEQPTGMYSGLGLNPPGPTGAPYLELERFPNKTGRCTLVYPTRPSLGMPISQFDALPGLSKMQARAMALWMLATERSIFPDPWLESEPNQTAEILEAADGRAGIVGRVKGGKLTTLPFASPPQAQQLIAMLEDNQRRTASLSSDLGGENPSNVRTGRAGEQLLGAATDFWVQEAQETLGLSNTEENKLAVAIAKSNFGDTPQSFYVGWKGAKGHVDYTPNIHFENDFNVVSWPVSGSDAQNIPIGIGQRLGLEEMSLIRAMQLDPWIDDPEENRRQLVAQSVQKAFMASIDNQVASGQIGPTELSQYAQKVLGGQDLYQAWDELHSDTQQQQAAQQAGPQGGGPQPGAPESMPGLSAPGQQVAQGLPAPGPAAGVSQPTPGMQHMQQLLQSLKGAPRPAGPVNA